ncbi:MAG: DUF1772 domain-containing protein [Verrucomicrobia bacterium]|nr:DUF1772 domain-containing protein [Verrucomicrobiota bacterium]
MQSKQCLLGQPLVLCGLFWTSIVLLRFGCLLPLEVKQPRRKLVLLGCARYFVGTMLVTFAFNVPLNDTLATLDPASAECATQWTSCSLPGRIGTMYEPQARCWLRHRSLWHSVQLGEKLSLSNSYLDLWILCYGPGVGVGVGEDDPKTFPLLV